jgi:EmrB/QacA subfamily drug resistance transporter
VQVSTTPDHPRRWVILGMLVVSLLVVVLDNTVLNVALRIIADPARGLGASQGQLEWAINSYTLAFAGLLFTWGIVADRVGRRRVLLISLAIFGLASVVSAYAHSPGQLVAARALMGLGGAGVLPATLSIISNVFDPRERAKAIGIWAGAVGLAAAIGPVVGGLLLEHFWWGSVFLINVPIVAAGMVGIALIVPESRDPRPGRIDVGGVLLSIVGLVGLVYGIIDGGEHGFARVQSIAPIVAGVAVLAGFVAYERRVAQPSLDVRLFGNPAFSAAIAAVGIVFFAAMGAMFFTAFYLQTVRGYSPLRSGAMFLPFAGAQLVFAPRSAALVRRFGPKLVCTGGLILVAAALFAMAGLGAHTPMWVCCVIFGVQGMGMANVLPPATESVMATLPRERAGVGSAVSNTIRQVGGALGVAVLGSVLSARYRDGFAATAAHLPAVARQVATESIGGAHGVADRLGVAGRGLIGPADTAFLNAMHVTALASAGVALIGVAVALVWLPRRSGPLAPAGAQAASARAGEPAVAGADGVPGVEAVAGGAGPGGELARAV